MPEQPAKNFLGFAWGGGAKHAERLATPEELAEYGALGPDPETEAKILALFEEQLLQDLIREAPAQTVLSSTPAAATEDTRESAVKLNEAAEAPKVELAPELVVDEIGDEKIEGPAEEVAVAATSESIPAAVDKSKEHIPETHVGAVEEETADLGMLDEVLADKAVVEVPAIDEAGDLAEVTAEQSATSGDLLEFAEVLDQPA